MRRRRGHHLGKMRGCFLRRPLPSKRLGEATGRATQPLDEIARRRDPVQGGCHCGGVSMRNEIAGLTISD